MSLYNAISNALVTAALFAVVWYLSDAWVQGVLSCPLKVLSQAWPSPF